MNNEDLFKLATTNRELEKTMIYSVFNKKNSLDYNCSGCSKPTKLVMEHLKTKDGGSYLRSTVTYGDSADIFPVAPILWWELGFIYKAGHLPTACVSGSTPEKDEILVPNDTTLRSIKRLCPRCATLYVGMHPWGRFVLKFKRWKRNRERRQTPVLPKEGPYR